MMKKEDQLGEDFTKAIGDIVKVQGPLVTARITNHDLAPVLSTIGQSRDEATMIVIRRAKDGRVHCLASDKLKRSAGIYESESRGWQRSFDHLDSKVLGELVEQMAGPERTRTVQQTGIKVLDLLAPIGVGGRVGFFGKAGVGRIVLAEELLWHRLKGAPEIHVFVFVEQWDLLGTQDALLGESELAPKIA